MSSTGSASTKKAEQPEATGPRSGDPLGLPDRGLGGGVGWRWPASGRPPRLPDLELAARPGLLALTAVLLVGLCAVLACWTSPPDPAPAGNDLLAGDPSPNLNLSSAEAPPAAPPPEGFPSGPGELTVPAPAAPELAPAPTPVPPPAAPVMPAPAAPAPEPMPPAQPVPAPVAPEPQAEVPLVVPAGATQTVSDDSCIIRNPLRGDTPMMRDWKMLGLNSFLAGAMAIAPTPALAADQAPAEPNKDDVIARQLGEIQKDVKQIAELKKSIEKLDKLVQERISEGRSTDLKVEKTIGDINKLERQIAQLQQDLDALRKRSTTGTQISGYGSVPVPATPSTGRIRLVNTFPQTVTVIVNSRAYDLSPGETRYTEPLPAGSFSYEVLGVQPSRERQLAASETFTINVHPR